LGRTLFSDQKGQPCDLTVLDSGSFLQSCAGELLSIHFSHHAKGSIMQLATFQSTNQSVKSRRKSKRSRRRDARQSLLEVLDLRQLLTASTSATTPYWQTVMPNQLSDGGQLAMQNSPMLLTIDDGLTTRTR